MTTYSWTCACGTTILASSDNQLDMAKKRHYNRHAKESGWELQK